eukprot:1247179-Amphidinium_carterae.3
MASRRCASDARSLDSRSRSGASPAGTGRLATICCASSTRGGGAIALVLPGRGTVCWKRPGANIELDGGTGELAGPLTPFCPSSAVRREDKPETASKTSLSDGCADLLVAAWAFAAGCAFFFAAGTGVVEGAKTAERAPGLGEQAAAAAPAPNGRGSVAGTFVLAARLRRVVGEVKTAKGLMPSSSAPDTAVT